MLPPGRASEATRPAPTGSPASAITIGTTAVACFAVSAAGVPNVTMTSTLSPTNSVAISLYRSERPPAQRNAIATLRPSVQPSSRSRSTKADTHGAASDSVLEPKNPIVGSLRACCARAASGHARPRRRAA